MSSGIYIRTKKNIENLSKARIGKPSNAKGKHWKVKDTSRLSKGKMGNKNATGKHLFPMSEIGRKNIGDSKRGSKCYFWKGGISYEPYSVDWTETLKRAIRERDHYICQICNENGWIVHHIDYNKKNCNPDNLITLCSSCHTRTNHNRNFWIAYFYAKN